MDRQPAVNCQEQHRQCGEGRKRHSKGIGEHWHIHWRRNRHPNRGNPQEEGTVGEKLERTGRNQGQSRSHLQTINQCY